MTDYSKMVFADGKMLAEVDDGVGLITFNQPEKRNAMSVAMWVGMAEILDLFEADPDVRVVILTGAGPKAFVSGADISQFESQRGSADAQIEYDRLTSAGRDRLAAFPKAVIARIRGFCLGGGLGIAMQADLRIAATDSEFGIPAARLGIAYGFGMTSKLVDLVGPAHAKMMLFTGNRMNAAEAARIGLINQVTSDEELSDVVVKIARQIADNAPLSILNGKRIVAETLKGVPDIAMADRLVANCFDSADYREGRTAFMEKRRPVFTGR
jgi:1,4-dihydroxy-2-naphthoyl-CoA synthase